MPTRFFILPLVFLVATSAPAQQPTAPSIVGPEVELWMEADGSGFMFDAVRMVIADAGYAEQVELRPLARSLAEFEQRKFECYVSGDREAIEGYLGEKLDLISSQSFHIESLHAFTLPGQAAISSLEELRGKSIGIQLGGNPELFGLGAFRDKIIEVPKVHTLMELLKLRRIDVLIDYSSANDMFSGELNYDEGFILYELRHTITCFRNSQNERFIKAVDRTLIKMETEGRIEEIYGRYLKTPES